MHPYPKTHLLTSLAFLACSAFSAAYAQSPAPDPSAPAPNAFFFHDGDTPVVFLGDSITEQRRYTTLIETYILTRYPSWNITFRNAGWGGDTSWLGSRGDFDTALQRDMIALQPKAVLIDFGMNDARGGDASYSRYLESTTKLVKGLEKAGARVALVTPSPEERYEPGAPAGSAYNTMLKKYADGLKIVSDNERVPFIDQFTPFVNFIEAGRKAGVLSAVENPSDPNARLIPDGIHPCWGGHLIMASVILQALHAPAEVSSLTLDAAGHSITASSGCTAEWQDSLPGFVQFKRTDDVLPWPLPDDPTVDVALKIPGFDPETSLNHYEMKVTGLTAPSYNLTIDGVMVGTYTSTDLANGLNLALVRKGPIYDQVQQILKTVEAKNDAYFERWRNVQIFKIPKWLASPVAQEAQKGELKRLDQVISDAEQSLAALRKPAPHIFKLEPVGGAK